MAFCVVCCLDDAVYLPDEELLKEYVLNDSGVCYQGNYNHITAKSWYYGQVSWKSWCFLIHFLAVTKYLILFFFILFIIYFNTC